MQEKLWPADKGERRPIDSLIPYARNSRRHSQEQINAVAASMKEWGFTTPVLIDDSGGIIAGHCRVMSAKKLGYTEVPVIIASGWTEAQKKAYIIADNKLSTISTWDDELLALELQELSEMNFDLSLTGFDEAEIDELLESLNKEIDKDADAGEGETPEPPPEPVTKLGDIWLLGKHRLMCGNGTDTA